MSTSLETSPNPSPSNKFACGRFRVVLPRFADKALAVLAAAVLLIGGGLVALRKLSEPRLPAVSYDDAKPGDVVHWCVDNVGEVAYTDGKPSHAIAWLGGAPPTHSTTSGGRCWMMQAKVVERRSGAVVLDFHRMLP